MIEIHKGNILDVESDALVYSTNTRLALTGGVGASLVDRFGPLIQTKLINESSGSGMELASVGDVYCVKTDNMPWMKVFHTVCSDSSYIVTEEIVKKVISKVITKCKEDAVKTIAISELGTGFGSLQREEFRRFLSETIKENELGNVKKIVVCEYQC